MNPETQGVALSRLLAFLCSTLVLSLVLRLHGAPADGIQPAAPVQPLLYSHKAHVALGLDCRGCHTNPDAGKLMTYPPTSLCMACHRTKVTDRPSIQKLAEIDGSGGTVPWVRVYKVADYVYWQHGTHLQAGIACADCHGPVAERDVMRQETNITTMPGCLSCHNKRQILTDCGDCHAPRQ